MIKLYVAPSCTSCRKSRQWLEDHDLNFIEKNVQHQPFSKDELRHILSLTENGTEDLISYRSKAYKELDLNLNELTTDELLDLFIQQPSLVRRPILIDNRRLQIGYNEEEIRSFLPREIRRLQREELYEKMDAAGL